jgi:small redox-active disulfide protein 2
VFGGDGLVQPEVFGKFADTPGSVFQGIDDGKPHRVPQDPEQLRGILHSILFHVLHTFNVAKSGNFVKIRIDTSPIVSNNGNQGDTKMDIKILGTGCPKCKALEANAKMAIEEAGIDATIGKITDVDTIMDMGVMMTPALSIDGEVKSAGKVLNKNQILKLLEGGN